MKKTNILLLFFLCSYVFLSAQSTATYRITFESAWSNVTHPVDFPSDPHWSGIVGMTHNSSTPLFEQGMIATEGIVNVAQSGNRDALNDEIEDVIDDDGAEYLINGGGISLSPDVINFEIEISSTHSYLSLVSMLAPSPDWFVGLKDLNLYEGGEWAESHTAQFTIYDAGSDSGTTFTSSNQNTDPREGISLLNDGPLVVNGSIASLGLWRIERIDNGSNCDVSGGVLEGGPFEICVDGIADQLSESDISISNESGGNSQWVITSFDGEILGLPSSFTDPNFDAAGPGICYIWHLSYEDGIEGLEMGNNISALEGCYDLSNSTYVKRETCGGGFSTATYRVTFESAWSNVTHPVDIPSDPHWSGIVGMTHNSSTPLFEQGMIATEGIVNVAQSGNRNALNDEIEEVIDDGGAEYLINGGGISLSPDVINFEIEISSTHSYLSLVSMLAPSPDWFVGLKGLNLYEGGEWAESRIAQFTIYDAGSDSGTTFTSSNQNTDPREGISLIDDGPLVVNGSIASLGLWRIERIDNDSDCDVSGGVLEGGPFEICVDGIADQLSESDISISNESGENSQWVITGFDGEILGLPSLFTDPNFDAAGPGICYIWHLSYEDGIEGLEMGNNISALEGCYQLSNSTYVKRETCGGDGFDLSLDIEVDQLLYDQYEHVLYTITLKNEGNMNATNISVAAGLPEGMVYSDHETSAGDYSLYYEKWDIEELKKGESTTLELTLYTLVDDITITNFVEVIDVDQDDMDSTPNNGNGLTSNEDDEAAVTITPSNEGGVGGMDGNADLALEIEVDADTYEQYERVLYTIMLTNNGPDDATDIEVAAGLPEGMVYSDHHLSKGDYSLYHERWRLDLASGQSAYLELQLFTLIEDVSITNFVEVFSVGQNDPDSTPGNGNGQTPNEDDEAAVTIHSMSSATFLILDEESVPNSLNLPETTTANNQILLTNLYPIPAQNWVKTDILSSENDVPVMITIVNAQAQSVIQREIVLQEGLNVTKVDIANLPSGVYWLNMHHSNGKIATKKIIKIYD